jgi:predicted phosphodiesterase
MRRSILKIVIFSDLHSNIYALKNILNKENDADKFISLGDNIGYAPYNNECLNMLKENNIKSLLGNHEEYFLRGYPSLNCTQNAKDFFETSYNLYDKKDNSYINNFDKQDTYLETNFVHTVDDKYLYPNSEINMGSITQNTFIGHSHIQFIKYQNNKFLCNVGSLGQNRLNMSIGQYVIWYPEKNIIVPSTIDTNVDKLMNDMKIYHYDKSLIDYYKDRVYT